MKIKILQFTIASSKGGRTQYLLNLWRNIDKSKFQFDFITFSSSLDFADELLAEGCKIHYLTCHPEADEEKFREEFAAVLQNKYDVIHIHTSFWKGMLVEHMAKEYGVKKIIIHAHSSGISGEKEEVEKRKQVHYSVRMKLSEDSATDFVACSGLAAEWLYGDRIPDGKIKILANSVETEHFAYNKEQRNFIRKEFGLNDEFVIGHVGRLAQVKNHKFLLEAFAEIVKHQDNVRLWIVGEGSKRDEIQKQIKENHLENYVKLFGKRDDINVLLQGMDCFALPSTFEGFPIALVESQTAGLPSIVSDVVTREVAVTDYIDYLPLTKEKWVARILQLIEERPERVNGEALVKQAGLDVSTHVKILEELYIG